MAKLTVAQATADIDRLVGDTDRVVIRLRHRLVRARWETKLKHRMIPQEWRDLWLVQIDKARERLRKKIARQSAKAKAALDANQDVEGVS